MSSNQEVRSQAFDSLRAEHELPWLHHVFVVPSFVNQIAGERSIVLVGEHGSGKTSLRLWLSQWATESPQRLMVNWSLSSTVLQGEGLQALEKVQAEFLRECVRSLIYFLSQRPTGYFSGPTWLRESVSWLVTNTTAGKNDLFFRQLRRGLEGEQARLLDEVLGLEHVDADIFDAGLSDILGEVTGVVNELGLQGIWVMIDGLESWVTAAPLSLDQQVRILLSTLQLFETPGLAFKLFVPEELENSLVASGAVITRRLHVTRIRWEEQDLRSIVEQRLAWSLGKKEFSIESLGHPETLLGLLRDYGGGRPLGWLQLLRPFLDRYTRDLPSQTLSKQQCLEIWRNHPPRLHIEPIHQQVFLGFRMVVVDSGSGFLILHYLYENRHRTCSYEELYYIGYRGFDRIPSPIDEAYEVPKSWKHNLESIMSRLRKSIDIDPRNPPYILTERQRGFRLQNIT